jgi:hypothetical protein
MAKKPVRKRRKPRQAEENALDRALEATFPASDPPSQTDPSRGIKQADRR